MEGEPCLASDRGKGRDSTLAHWSLGLTSQCARMGLLSNAHGNLNNIYYIVKTGKYIFLITRGILRAKMRCWGWGRGKFAFL